MDFESMIRDAIKQGMSTEDISKAVTNAMNKCEAEARERDKQSKKGLFISGIKDDVYDAFEDRNWEDNNYSDVANWAMIIASYRHPEWSEDTLRQFMKSVEDSIKMLDKMQGWSIEDMKKYMKTEMEKIFPSLRATKEKVSRDTDIVSKFLRDLGL